MKNDKLTRYILVEYPETKLLTNRDFYRSYPVEVRKFSNGEYMNRVIFSAYFVPEDIYNLRFKINDIIL